MAFRALQFPSGGSGVTIPVSSANFQLARNPIVEDAMSSVGEANHYGGIYVSSGSFEAPYRPVVIDPIILHTFGGAIANGIAELPSNPWTSMAIADEYGSAFSFPSVYVNSMTFTFNVKEFAKISFNWIGHKVFSGATAITVEPDYSNDIALFYNAQLQVGGTIAGAVGLTIQIERPIDQDYYILGSEFLQDVVQSGPVNLSGTLTLAPKEWANFKTAITANTDNYIGTSTSNKNAFAPFTIVITLRTPAGAALRTITIDSAVVDTQSLDMQGRQKLNKTINWKGQITGTGSGKNNIKITNT